MSRFVEKDIDAAVVAYVMGKDVMVMDCETKQIVTMEDFLAAQDYLHFLVDEDEATEEEPEMYTDEEFEARFEPVPEEAPEDPEEPATEKKTTRAEKRHMIERLAAEHPELSVGDIAERVGVSTATVRKYIK